MCAFRRPHLVWALSRPHTCCGHVWQVHISGDPAYFPAFKDTPSHELSHWLEITTPTNAAYFEHTMELIALLVRGRNLKNVAAVRGESAPHTSFRPRPPHRSIQHAAAGRWM